METQVHKSLDARIQRALDVIHGGPNRRYAISDLASTVGLSDSHFHHLFRRETGVSPARYLHDLMLREAAYLIKTTSLPVKDVFHIVGVTDPSHFIRSFRKAYGFSPSSYRRRQASSEERKGRESKSGADLGRAGVG